MIAAIDIETKDPFLKQYGPGSIRGAGFIIGVGVYCPDKKLAAFFRPNDPQLRYLLEDSSIDKVFHNGVYDLDWLTNGPDHLKVNGRIEDTMTRETLLDAYAFSYSLDVCCEKHGVEGKNKEDTIDMFWKNVGGKGKAIEHLDEIPFDVVGKYCIQDCRATYNLYMAQQPLLEQQDLLRANDIEVRLYPLLMEMRRNGFPIDVKRTIALGDEFTGIVDKGIEEISLKYGINDFSLNSSNDIEKIWKAEGLPVEYTAKGKPSFTSEILAECTHPVAHQIMYLRGLVKTLSFLNGWIDLEYNGRLHSVFYPAKRDDGGTVTGRWSSQSPNLQQVSAREDKHGPEVRGLFIPEEGCYLGAFDYKQIEYRTFIHFAQGEGAVEAQKQFSVKEIDYHQMVQEMMGWITEDKIQNKLYRHITKNLNFGSLYGMGPRSFAARFKIPLMNAHPDADPDNLVPLATSLMNEYFRKVPFVKPTCNKIMDVGQRRGYVRTLSGKRQRMPLDNGVYKLINYLIQGSAADLLKKGLVDAWEKGVFNILKIHATVHDEVVFSLPQTKEAMEAAITLKECLSNAYEMKIPIGVDTEIGNDWGHCEGGTWNEFCKRYS